MLANGATLSVKAPGDADYKNLPGLKEIPEMGMDPEKVENTTLTDQMKQYEMGIGDPGDMNYVFKYVNAADTDAWRILKAIETSGQAADFKEVLKDGTTTTFSAFVAVKRGGGGVNDPMNFTAALALNSAIATTDPA